MKRQLQEIEDASPSAQSESVSDIDIEIRKRRRVIENKKLLPLKYHNFLPGPIIQNIEQEIENMKYDFMNPLRKFFSAHSTVEQLQNFSLREIEELEYIRLKLIRYLELKYPLTTEEKEEVLKLLFPLASSLRVDYALQEKICSTMVALLKEKDHLNIVFPWRPLYKLIKHTYFAKYRAAIYTPKNHDSSLIELVRNIRKYFSKEATDEILEEMKPILCVQDHILFEAQGFLCLFLPTTHKRVDWVPFIMSTWDWAGIYPTWDSSITNLFSRLAEHNCGSINWEPYFDFIFTKILKCFDLPIGNSLPSIYDEYPMDDCSIFVNFDFAKNMVLINSAKWIIWMLSPQNNVMTLLKQLLRSIESFYQPSNEGMWSGPLGDFLLILSTKFAKRLEKEKTEEGSYIPQEHRLTHEMVTEFANMILPISMTAMYSKSPQVTTAANHTLKHLSYIAPEIVFPPLMERCFHALQTLTETHQTTSALETLSLVIFSLLKQEIYPDGQKYLPDLLQLTLPGIDSNDLAKTWICLKFYSALLVSLPLVGADSSRKGETDILSFSFFEEWCFSFLDRLFAVLSNQGPIPKDQQSDTVSPELFWGICDLFFNQLSDDLHSKCLKKVFDFVSTEFLVNAKKNVGHLVAALSYANPKTTLAMFVPMCYNRLVNGNKLSQLTTQETEWYVHILSQAVYRSGEELLPYKKQIFKIIELTYDAEEKIIVKTCGKLIKNVLKSWTFYYVKDTRSVNPSIWRSKEFEHSHFDRWADYPYLEDFEIEWHVPSVVEIDSAVECINTYMEKPYNRIKEFIASISSEQKVKETKIVKHSILLLGYMLKGASMLLPEMTTDIIPEKSRFPDATKISSGIGQVDKSKLIVNYEIIADMSCSLVESLLQYRKDTEPKIFSLATRIMYFLICARGGVTGVSYKKKLSSHRYVKAHNFRIFKSTKNKYPRYMRVIRTILVLNLRCVLHNDSLLFTKAHERIFKNLFYLCISSYSKVRSYAQDVFMAEITKFSNRVLEGFIPQMISTLQDKKATEDQLTGAVYLLERNTTKRLIMLNWNFLGQFIKSICQTEHVEKFTNQTRVVDLYESYFNSYYQTTLDESSIPLYKNLICELVNLAESNPNWHWKFLTMVASFFMIVIRNDNRVLFPLQGFKWLLKNMTSDIEKLRQISIECVSILLSQYKPIHPRRIIALDPKESWFKKWETIHYPTNEQEWNECTFFEKNWFGWFTVPKQAIVYIYDSAVLHENISVDKFAVERVQLQAILKEMILDSKEFLPRFFELYCIREDSFHEANAQLFKGFFQLLGPQFLEKSKPHLQHMLTHAGNGKQEEVFFMASAAEFVCGYFRGCKHWSFQDMKQSQDFVLTILEKALDHCSVNSIQEWCDALEFAVCDKDPRRCHWLRDFVLKKFESAITNGSSAVQLRFLRFTQSVIAELGWRNASHMDKILKILSQHAQAPYQQVREHVSAFIALIFKSLWTPPRRSDTLAPVMDISVSTVTNDIRPSLLQFYKQIQQQFASATENLTSSLNGQSVENKKLVESNGMEETMEEPPTPSSSKSKQSGLDELEEEEMIIETIDEDLIMQEEPPSALPVSISTSSLESNSNSFKNLSKTVLAWISGLYASQANNILIEETTEMINFLSEIQDHSEEEEILNLVNDNFLLIAGYPFNALQAKKLLKYFKEVVSSHHNWKVRSLVLDSLQIFGYRQQFFLSNIKQDIFDIILNLLQDQQIEVREMASIALAGFIKVLSTDSYLTQLTKLFHDWSKEPQIKKGGKTTMKKKKVKAKPVTIAATTAATTLLNGSSSPIPSATTPHHSSFPNAFTNSSATADANSNHIDENIVRHAGVLGLASMIQAFPYDIPDFLVPVMVRFAKFAHDTNQPIRETVRKTFALFWKSHNDMWSIQKKKFNEDQLVILTDLLVSPSYYA